MKRAPVTPDQKPTAVGNPKADDLAPFMEEGAGKVLTTNQGVRVNDDQNTLKAGERGPSLLEDFHFREKITHFDHERIPERVVHARGAGAHGYFQVYEDMSHYTKAAFLQDPGVRTPVFVRFSTVAGSRGSSDLARDVRGFAVKFYTQEGVFDLVGNNIPIFFIQDAIKFPDLIHAVKPEPDNEIPQAASAHDTFWDFISLMPESTHMIMWVMSDRAIPRSYRMMEGFGIHTFRLIDQAGKSRFVKFHWKPLLGMHSLLWDEAQKVSGKDPDFHRRDLWEAIEQGKYPEWEFGVQIVEEDQEHAFDFDLLDPTKIIPEEIVPVRRIGKLVLNRNPENFFAETEQVAFHPGHVVPGIDFSDDPLLQGRLFSYTDTQLIRLGGPNFHEIPINRSVAPVHNLQRDGHMRQTINRGKVAYEPNSIGGGCPMQARAAAGGFVSFPERIAANKVRARSEKFFDHFSQATMFFQSLSEPEQDHVVEAFRFELGKVSREYIRQRMVSILGLVDGTLAARVAQGLGLDPKKPVETPINHSFPADGDPKNYEPRVGQRVVKSPALSMVSSLKNTVLTRKVAILAADGVESESLRAMMSTLIEAGAAAKIVAPTMGAITGNDGSSFMVDFSLLTASSVLFDGVYIPGGKDSVAALSNELDAVDFIHEAYRHLKTLVATGDGVRLLRLCPELADLSADHTEPGSTKKTEAKKQGVLATTKSVTAELAQAFVSELAKHRHWGRRPSNRIRPTSSGKDTRGAGE
jgi:catalase